MSEEILKKVTDNERLKRMALSDRIRLHEQAAKEVHFQDCSKEQQEQQAEHLAERNERLNRGSWWLAEKERERFQREKVFAVQEQWEKENAAEDELELSWEKKKQVLFKPIRKMVESGLTIKQISQYTDLTEEEIKEILITN